MMDAIVDDNISFDSYFWVKEKTKQILLKIWKTIVYTYFYQLWPIQQLMHLCPSPANLLLTYHSVTFCHHWNGKTDFPHIYTYVYILCIYNPIWGTFSALYWETFKTFLLHQTYADGVFQKRIKSWSECSAISSPINYFINMYIKRQYSILWLLCWRTSDTLICVFIVLSSVLLLNPQYMLYCRSHSKFLRKKVYKGTIYKGTYWNYILLINRTYSPLFFSWFL